MLFSLRSGLSPLPATKEEVDRGQQLFGGQTFIRNAANWESFNHASASARILHLATHAQVVPESPLETAFFLYPQADNSIKEKGEKVSLLDLYNDQIPSELVILSACQTGNGDLSKGEGPMSLARAFRYAGSKSVLMNLWNAPDETSSDIVIGFLSNMRQGMPKDLALQKAKLAYMTDAGTMLSHPFFWAGLMIYGDQRPLFPGRFNFTFGIC
jgi:CHAT domain-containing protein